MRKVKFAKWIKLEVESESDLFSSPKNGTGCWSEMIYDGMFHQWCFDNDGCFAVIEDADGFCHYIPIHNLRFLTF
jgi:hypothetical protein